MKILSAANELSSFLNVIAERKKQFDQWCYVHIFTEKWDGAKLPINEVAQFMPFYFGAKDLIALAMPQSNEIIFITKRGAGVSVNKFEKELAENFKEERIRSEIRNFDVSGLDALDKVITPYISKNDPKMRIQMIRIKRAGNCIMILDDDEMVTRQLDKLLNAVGYVVALNKTENFLQQYIEYAPDILFLDIHLRTEKGNELLRRLMNEIDPQAHVVMISSDTGKKIVLDIKDGGAKGFIVKPFDRGNVIQHLMRAPTIVLQSVAL